MKAVILDDDAIKIGQVYRHYKGNLYKVIAIALDTESDIIDNPTQASDNAKRVIYYALDKPEIIWDRPYQMFAGNVTINGQEQKRFTVYSSHISP
jgi:hypothetical protein